MGYYLYRLNFSTALHMGKDSGGASLDDGQMTIHADTLFAALCCEAAGDGRIEQLVGYFTDGTLTISDALPFTGDDFFFLPVFVGNKVRKATVDLESPEKVEYIPLSFFLFGVSRGLNQPAVDLEKLSSNFGQLTVSIRVAIKTIPCRCLITLLPGDLSLAVVV